MSWEIDNRVANGIATVGSVMAIIMWAAPIRDVFTAEYSIYKTKSTENVATAFGFVAGTFNCLLWNLFAVTRLETMLVPFIVNCLGFVLNVSLVICYLTYADSKKRRQSVNQLLFMFFVTAVSVILWVVEQSNDIVGYIAAFVNILMLFGPLAAAGDVIRNRSSKGLSLLPLLMTLIASIVWFIFGVYIKEIPAMIPNGLGILFGIMQLSLFAWARNQERKSAEVDILSEDFEPVSGIPTTVHRQRVTSIGSLIAEGP